MKKVFFITLILISCLALALKFGFKPLSQMLGYQTKAGIKVTSTPEATVFINGLEAGKTPYQDENLKVGEYEVKLVSGEAVWQNKVSLNAGTLSVVNRELGTNIASSSGETLILNPGKGIVITSTPNEAEVEIDGKIFGKTPLSVVSLEFGEHTFILSHDNYLKRSIRAVSPKDLLLHLDVDLAVAEVDLSNISTPVITEPVKLAVKKTPTGFLRVRDKPSLAGKEIAKVSDGDILTQISTSGSWIKVQLEDNTEGYVSSTYVQKQN